MKENNNMVLFFDGPFSQWHPSRIVIGNQEFNRSEQYMMYRKAMVFHDYEMAIRILDAQKPDEQKAFGRLVKNFNAEKWEVVAYGIVLEATIAKFTQNLYLRSILMDTGEKVIAEASPVDCVWGIGLAESNPDAFDEAKWRGRNLLGKALMEARRILS